METKPPPISPSAPKDGRSQAAIPRAAEKDHASESGAVPADLPRPGILTIIALALLFLVLLAGLYILGRIPHQAAEVQIKADAADLDNDVPIVTVASPTRKASSSDLALPCDVRADMETSIYPRTSGYLKTRYVDIQSKVVAGQLLAEIDSPEVDDQLRQAQGALAQANAALDQAHASVDKSKALYELAQATLDRYRDLKKNGFNTVTIQELEEKENAFAQARGDIAVAQANVHADQANVQAAQATVDRFITLQGFEKVHAPFDGVITTRNYDTGALLSATEAAAGKEMFRIAKVDQLRVFVNVPQVYSGDIKIPSDAYLNVRSHAQVQGVVARKSDAVDPNTRTMLFELHFANPDGTLYPGMYGEAKLQISQDHPVLTIPVAALRFDAKGIQVAVVRDNTIHLQKVKLGRDLGTSLEVIEGLSPEDQIVTNLSDRLSEGSSVKIQTPAPAATNPSAPAATRSSSN